MAYTIKTVNKEIMYYTLSKRSDDFVQEVTQRSETIDK